MKQVHILFLHVLRKTVHLNDIHKSLLGKLDITLNEYKSSHWGGGVHLCIRHVLIHTLLNIQDSIWVKPGSFSDMLRHL